jgi:hypothetical protein
MGNFKQLFDIMGFAFAPGTTASEQVPSVLPVPQQVWGSTGITFCQNIRYVDICSPQLTQNQGMPDSTTQPIQRDAIVRLYVGDSTTNVVPCDDPDFTPPGCAPFVIYREFPYPKQMRWNAEQNIGSSIQFQVYDDSGNILDFDLLPLGAPLGSTYNIFGNINWNMSMLVTEN